MFNYKHIYLYKKHYINYFIINNGQPHQQLPIVILFVIIYLIPANVLWMSVAS